MLESLAGIPSSAMIRPVVTLTKRRGGGLGQSSSHEGVRARQRLTLGPQVATTEVECNLFLDTSAITARSFGRLWYSPSNGILAASRLQNRIRTFSAVEQDLLDVQNEAEAEGWPVPSDRACTAARRVLVEMFEILPCRYEVYPTSHGEIAIDLPSDFSVSILVVCASDSHAMYFVTSGGKDRIQEHVPVNKLPDQFLRQHLVRLIEENGRYL